MAEQIHEPTVWDAEITAKMEAAGFELRNTGGNIQSWWIRLADGNQIAICYSDGCANGNPLDEAWSVSLEDPDGGSDVLGDLLTLDGAIAAAKEPRQ